MNNDPQFKMRWLRPAMNGDDDAIVKALVEFLPGTESISADGLKQMEVARNYMAELFLRGISLSRFYMDSGLTGFEIDPKEPGTQRLPIRGCASPAYYRLWSVDKDPAVATRAIQNLLLSRRNALGEEHSQWFQLQVAIDVDNDSPVDDMHPPFSLESGLTPKAVCFEVCLADIEGIFARISETCQKLGPKAQNKLRLIIGSFGQQEVEGMCKLSLFSKGLSFEMAGEWILFKNIHRRAGKFGWFWQIVANRRDRKDH